MIMIPPQRQPDHALLWENALDRQIFSVGQRRTVSGRFFERAASALLGLPSLKTDCRYALCPDFASPDGRTFHENKAAGGSKVLIYQTALEKYREASTAGVDVVHWVWQYKLTPKSYQMSMDWESGTFQALAAARIRLHLIPFDVITAATSTRSPICLNSGVRSSASRTGDGWDLPLSAFSDAPVAFRGIVCGLAVNGMPLSSVELVDYSGKGYPRIGYVKPLVCGQLNQEGQTFAQIAMI